MFHLAYLGTDIGFGGKVIFLGQLISIKWLLGSAHGRFIHVRA